MQLEEKRTRRGKEESFDDSRAKVVQFGTMKVIRARRWHKGCARDRLKKDHPESEHKSALHKLTARSLSLLCVAQTPTLSRKPAYTE